MSAKDDIEQVVAALKTVPEKRLLLIELVNRVGVKGGELDYSKLADIQPELNLAIAEAKGYANQTMRAVGALIALEASEEEVLLRGI